MEIIFKFNTRDCWTYILLKNVLVLLCVGSFFVTSYVQMCNAQDDLHLCNNSNYTNAKTFQRNLNTVLNNLVRHTSSSSGFNISVSGQSPDRVYGLLQCRADVSVEECYNCSLQAKTVVLQWCGNFVGGKVWLPKCFVRYENYNFIGVLDKSYPNESYNGGRPTDPEALGKAVRELLTNLSDAAPHPSPGSAHPTETPADSPPSTHSKKSSNKSTILGIFGGLLLILLAGLFAIRGKVTSTIFGSPVLQGSPYEGDQHIAEVSLISRDEHIIFNLEILIAATSNFHENNKLGEGGFGTVYKGIMPDGTEVAVKKLSLKSTQGRKEFLTEVKLVAKVQHRNLVNLLGCCAEGFERLLVYEYLPNKSLDKILFDPQRVTQLDWQKRFNIIIGISRGLMYLHEDSQMRIIHRDIKASNILLDRNMNAKIADFGLARLFPEDETHVSTQVAGTYGYMAPEYAMYGQLSIKVDVYSFGVVLLEIVCGRKNTDFKSPLDFRSLVEWVWRSYSNGNMVDVIDRAVAESSVNEQAFRCIHIGLLCTQADASLRPLMSSVYSMLSNPSMEKLPDVTMPAFVNVTYNPGQSYTATNTTSTFMSSSTSKGTPSVDASINNESVTILQAR